MRSLSAPRTRPAGLRPCPRQNHLLAALERGGLRAPASPSGVRSPFRSAGPLRGRRQSRNTSISRSPASFPFSTKSENGTSVEAAITGNDGVVGVHLLMGGGATTSRAVVRNSGHGYRIRADVLKAKFESCPALRQPLLRYAQAMIVADDAERRMPRPSSAGAAVLPVSLLSSWTVWLERGRADAGHDGQSARGAPRKHHRGRRQAAGRRPDPVSPRPDHGD